ncbi:pyridoxamine 5'-phosphate oxidase family protein [Streptomyces sp. NPDC091209]|uniref:pyridoxamine 5'-phosphate oxidase family protein n=1 Tax=Streptomyces sp. NPDC091209 TaxID=3365974 RepID=UPI0037FC0DAF
MSAAPAALRRVEVTGAEALWLLEGAASDRLVLVRRDLTVIRPARHVGDFGRLVVRTPVQAAAVRLSATYPVDEVRAATSAGTGWTVTVAGPAEVVTDPNEAAHYRRTLAGWSHGPHDAIVRSRPRTVSGFRPAGGTRT